MDINREKYTKEELSLLEPFLKDNSIKWKQCKKCLRYFPIDTIFFSKEKRINDGFENSCRLCRVGKFLSKESIENPEKYRYRAKESLKLSKSIFKNKAIIIKYYEEYLKNDKIPYNSFIVDFFDIIIKYLFEEKYNISDYDILNLRREWIKKHKLYGYYLRTFNGSIVQMIEHVYPNRFKPWEFITSGIGYFDNDKNIDEALNWFIKQIKKDKVINSIEDIPKNINGETFRNYGLSSINIKFGHVYNIFEYLYPNKFMPWEYSPMPREYFSIKDNRIKSFKQLIHKIGIKIDNIPKLVSYEYINLGKYRKFLDMINEYYNFNINELIKECYPNKYKYFDMPYQNHYLTLDNIIVKSEPERMIHHLLIHNFNDNAKYEPEYFNNTNCRYIPDWMIEYKDKMIIVEYYGMLDMNHVDWNYDSKHEEKDIFYNELCNKNDKYIYMPLYVADIKCGMNGIVDKFKELGIDLDKVKYYR